MSAMIFSIYAYVHVIKLAAREHAAHLCYRASPDARGDGSHHYFRAAKYAARDIFIESASPDAISLLMAACSFTMAYCYGSMRVITY